jgi:hypothetical protein
MKLFDFDQVLAEHGGNALGQPGGAVFVAFGIAYS